MSKKNSPEKTQPAKKKTEATSKAPTLLSSKYILGGILLLALIIYYNGLHNDILTFDDNDYFNNYPEITKLNWASVKMFFTNYYLIMYQPLPVLTLAVNYHFSELHSFPMHVFNLVFHLMNIVLVFQFIKLLTKNMTTASIIALLFAIHPMNVEAVSWISARSSSMYTCFYLLALIAYLKYLGEQMAKFIVIAAVFFIISLFSKAQAVTLPVVLLLLDYYYDRKIFSLKVIAEKIPFFVLSIVFGLVTLMDKDTMANITTGMVSTYNPLDIFFIVCHSIVFYVTKFFLPFNLCAIYVYPPKDGVMLPFTYYLSAVIFVFLFYLLFRFRKNKDVVLGAGLFLITIAINIQLIPSRLFEVTDRYAYFPYLGLSLLLMYYVNHLKENNRVKYSNYKPYFMVALVIYGLVFSIGVYSRNTIWKNDDTLISDIIKKNPSSEYLARAYGNRGYYYKRNNRIPEAISDFSEAIKLKPNDSRNYFNRALTYMMTNDNASATADFDKAIELDPKQAVLYSDRAQTRLLIKDTTGGIEDAEKCLKLDSANADAYNTLATVEYARVHYDKCEQYLSLGLKFNPKFAIGFKNRGLLYQKQNKMDKACADFETASNLGNQDGTSLHQQYCH